MENIYESNLNLMHSLIKQIDSDARLGLGSGKSVYQLWTQLGADPFITRVEMSTVNLTGKFKRSTPRNLNYLFKFMLDWWIG